MAYAYKRKGGWYVGFLDERGVYKQQKSACRTKKDALLFAQDLERKAERVRLNVGEAEPTPVVFSALAEDYLAVEGASRRSSKDIAQRVRDHIIPSEFGEKLAHMVTAADIQKLLNAKAEEGLSPQTRSHLRNHLSAIFRYGIDQARALRGPNPVRAVSKIEVPERAPRALPHEALPALLAAAPDEFRGILAVALFSGLRKGEILGLKTTDILFDQGLIIVERSYNNATTKSGRGRAVPIVEALAPYLALELGRTRSEWLFPNERGEMRTRDCDLAAIFKRTLVRAGLVVGFDHICRRCRTKVRRESDVREKCQKCGMTLWPKGIPQNFAFKDARSTLGTFAYERTGDLRFVQKILGHSRIEVTDRRYAQFRPEHLLQQARKMNASATYPALTNNSPHARHDVGAIGQPLDMVTTVTARSRGLEPLTSGVTGRRELSVVVGSGRVSSSSSGVNATALSVDVGLNRAESVPLAYPGLTENESLLSVSETADLLGVTPQRVYQLVNTGKLPSHRAGPSVRIPASAVRNYQR